MANKKQETKGANAPEIKYGRGTLSTAIFTNTTEKDGKTIEFRNIQIQKSFKKDDKWEHRQISISANEVLKLMLYLQLCAQYIEENPIESENESPEELVEE